MTLIEILNAVLSESGFLERTSIAGSADVDDKQMVSIANRVAHTILDFYNWSPIRKTYTVVMTNDTRYPLPADYWTIIPDSVWETNGSRRVELPVPEGRWFMYKHTAFSDGGTIRARLYGDQIEIHDPQPGESFTFEYMTDAAITDSGDVPKEKFDNDTDKWLLDDEMLIKGIQAKWGHAKMMPQYQEWQQDFQKSMNDVIARTTGGKTIGGMASPLRWRWRRSPYYPLYRP